MYTVCIFSNQTDQSTNYVMDWIDYLGYKCIRINGEDTVTHIEVRLPNEFSIKLAKSGWLHSEEISSYWYRRGKINFLMPELNVQASSNIEPSFHQEVNLARKENINQITNYIFHLLEQKRHIGSFFTKSPNKLMILDLAHRCGLKIPKSVITSQKEKLGELHREYGPFITKSSGNGLFSHQPTFSAKTYTEVFPDETIEALPGAFMPSFFQAHIPKKYELRIFFLKDEFYPMAIFSQENDQTAIDFRKYDLERPNRKVPFQLPTEIEKKLKKLCEISRHDTGSIDMIVTPDNDYYFLEINPVGQFGMTSYPCNYQIERKIAEYLCHN